MTSVRRRYAALQASALTVAALSQLPGQVNGPIVLLTTPQTTYVQRQPVVTRYARQAHPIDLRTWTQNLLQSTLIPDAELPDTAGTGNAPTRDFPNHLRTHTQNLLETTLSEEQSASIALPQTCGWGNPPTKDFPAFLRTHTQSLQQSTLGLQTTYVQRQPVVTRYARRAHPIDLLTWAPSPLLSTLSLTVPSPAGQARNSGGHPVAIRRWKQDERARHQGRTWTHSILTSTLNIPVIAPFKPVDQPNPRGYVYPIALRTIAQDRIRTTLADQSEVPQTTAWSAAPVREFQVGLRGWIFQSQMPAPTPPPIRPLNYPNPQGPKPRLIELRTWAPPRSLALLYPPPTLFGAQGESKVYDYPNPRGYTFSKELRTWTHSLWVLTAPLNPPTPIVVEANASVADPIDASASVADPISASAGIDAMETTTASCFKGQAVLIEFTFATGNGFAGWSTRVRLKNALYAASPDLLVDSPRQLIATGDAAPQFTTLLTGGTSGDTWQPPGMYYVELWRTNAGTQEPVARVELTILADTLD